MRYRKCNASYLTHSPTSITLRWLQRNQWTLCAAWLLLKAVTQCPMELHLPYISQSWLYSQHVQLHRQCVCVLHKAPKRTHQHSRFQHVCTCLLQSVRISRALVRRPRKLQYHAWQQQPFAKGRIPRNECATLFDVCVCTGLSQTEVELDFLSASWSHEPKDAGLCK